MFFKLLEFVCIGVKLLIFLKNVGLRICLKLCIKFSLFCIVMGVSVFWVNILSFVNNVLCFVLVVSFFNKWCSCWVFCLLSNVILILLDFFFVVSINLFNIVLLIVILLGKIVGDKFLFMGC